MSFAEDLRGHKFGKLTMVRRAGAYEDGSALWLCRCECGAKRIVVSGDLRRHRSTSCKQCRNPREGCWTAEQEARLRELYPTTSTPKLAKLFGRTATAIKSRALILKVAKAVGHHGKAEWTSARIRELVRLYPNMHSDELARRLGVSVLALYQRAQKLGIRKSAAYLEQKRADEARRLTNSGVAHRFHKGQIPVNKGIRRPGWKLPGKA